MRTNMMTRDGVALLPVASAASVAEEMEREDSARGLEPEDMVLLPVGGPEEQFLCLVKRLVATADARVPAGRRVPRTAQAMLNRQAERGLAVPEGWVLPSLRSEHPQPKENRPPLPVRPRPRPVTSSPRFVEAGRAI